MRKIVHIDMDAFYASVEQRDDPKLRGRPVVVAWRGARSVVCAASYEARTFGIRSAMPAMRAERLCPHAVFVPPDFIRYRAVSKQVRAIFERHTDLVEPLSLDEAYLDVSENRLGLPSATAVASAIRASIREETQLTASAGIAPNKFLAKIASDWRKPDGQFVIKPAQVEAFLAPLPVSKLPGVGKVMENKLGDLGIVTVAQLRLLGAAELERRFGRWGMRLHELSLGHRRAPGGERASDAAGLGRGHLRARPAPGRIRGHAARAGGEGMGGRAKGARAHRPHRRAEAQDQRLPHPHPQPHAGASAGQRTGVRRYRACRCASASASPRARATGSPAWAWAISAPRTTCCRSRSCSPGRPHNPGDASRPRPIPSWC
jgi:predicted flap endonuclease-1-like 5' DNA nuclease